MKHTWLALLLGLALPMAGCGDDTDGGSGGGDASMDTDAGDDMDAGMDTDAGDDMDAGMDMAGDFTLSLDGYAPHEGKNVYVALVDEADGSTVGTAGPVAIASGEATLTIAGAAEDGKTYTVRWYVDTDDNGMCNFAADGSEDHAWEMTGQTADASGLSVNHTHDTNFTDVCSTFAGGSDGSGMGSGA